MPKYTIAIRELRTNDDSVQFDTYYIEAPTEREACELASDRFEREYPDEDVERFEIFAVKAKRR